MNLQIYMLFNNSKIIEELNKLYKVDFNKKRLEKSKIKKFKLLKTTGIDLPGEAGSIFLVKEKAGPVELATISFGQRFEITPIQLVTAVASIANGGKSIKPRVVKQIVNKKTGEVTDIPVEDNGTVISKETSEKVLSMMESVVSEGTRKKCKSCRI